MKALLRRAAHEAGSTTSQLPYEEAYVAYAIACALVLPQETALVAAYVAYGIAYVAYEVAYVAYEIAYALVLPSQLPHSSRMR